MKYQRAMLPLRSTAQPLGDVEGHRRANRPSDVPIQNPVQGGLLISNMIASETLPLIIRIASCLVVVFFCLFCFLNA